MPENNQEKQIIEYEYPKFSRIAFSNILDFLLCALLALAIFIPTKKIVESNGEYSKNSEDFDALKIESNLYIYSSEKSRVQDVVSFYNASTKYSQSEMEDDLSKRLDNFIVFLTNKVSVSTGEEVKKIYDDFRLSDSLLYNGSKYFILENNTVSKNVAANIPSKEYVENVYKAYIDKYALGQFIAKDEVALNYQKYFSNMLFFVELPISIGLGLLIYFYLIPFCFSRGKRTIGKLAFHIGVVNSKCLSPKFWEFTVNFLIFFILECLLSVVALGIPLIISFSMCAFSKKKQNFHNYITGFYLVDTTQKIYKSFDEIVKNELNSKDPVNFRQK